jgi:hypothetical protein
MFVAIICYCTFQAFFTYNLFIVRTVMFALALEASYLITKISVSASRLANEVSVQDMLSISTISLQLFLCNLFLYISL